VARSAGPADAAVNKAARRQPTLHHNHKAMGRPNKARLCLARNAKASSRPEATTAAGLAKRARVIAQAARPTATASARTRSMKVPDSSQVVKNAAPTPTATPQGAPSRRAAVIAAAAAKSVPTMESPRPTRYDGSPTRLIKKG
jgi:hypothetical protein